MRLKRLFLGLVAVFAAGGAMAAYELTPTVHAERAGETPELGQAGSYRLGTAVVQMTLPARGRITALSMVSGHEEVADRIISVRYWYPADPATKGKPARYDHVMHFPAQPPFPVSSQGAAIADASPLPNGTFPLVLMSHGYGGWGTQFSNLAEHIASHGYVVAAIEHQDMPADSVATFLASFGNVLVDRTLDQRQVLARIASDVRNQKAPYLRLIDLRSVGLIGYSMGGYGAINSAGAPYRLDDGPLARIPQTAKDQLRQAAAEAVPIKALVLFSPWGGQPDSRAWDAAALTRITHPVLLVAGDQDDVVNFKDGVSWLFRNMTGSDRYMLVYREARHNIVGNQFNLAPDAPFVAAEFLKEPVWRSDRLNAINQHFVTAFLDLTLKGEEAKRTYLAVPTIDSDGGEWPTSFGEQLNGMVAGPTQNKYWRGFQRRWATGLEMHHAGPDKSSIESK